MKIQQSEQAGVNPALVPTSQNQNSYLAMHGPQDNLKSWPEESKLIDSPPKNSSPCTDAISAMTVMLKSTDDRYLPHKISIESGNLVISIKQVSLGNAPFFHPLDSFSIQSIDTEDQKEGNQLFSAKLRFEGNSHRTLCFIQYSHMCAIIRAIHCAQGFNSRLEQYKCIKQLPPTSSLSEQARVMQKMTGIKYEMKVYNKCTSSLMLLDQ